MEDAALTNLERIKSMLVYEPPRVRAAVIAELTRTFATHNPSTRNRKTILEAVSYLIPADRVLLLNGRGELKHGQDQACLHPRIR
jgi:hypothetical protein